MILSDHRRSFIAFGTGGLVLAALAVWMLIAGTASAATLCVNPGGTGGCSSSIQAAVAAASAGDTINVAAGTYTEVGQIVISKNLTIVGAGAGSTIVKPSADTGNGGDARGWFLVNSGVSFNLSKVTLDGTGHLVWQGIRDHGTGTISDCSITNIKFNASGPDYAGTGIVVFGSPVNVTNCTFSGIGRVGVLFYGTGVTGSTFSNNTYTGKGAGNWLDYGVEVGAGANATISGNTISGDTGVATVDGSTSAGILVSTYFNQSGDPATAATITGNNITGNTDGIAVGYNAADYSVVVAHLNNITGNPDAGVVSAAPLVNATCNWWGAANGPGPVGPGSGDKVSANVTFTPWLIAAAPAGLCTGPLPTPNPNAVGGFVDVVTGGSGSGGSMGLSWLLAGLVAITAVSGGGLWTLLRRRS
jgi:Pectate lyase superfamily protein